jgi:pyrroloquinoline quinone biosynthesis protein B
MRVRVLGSAAGGGFPQWNCGCVNCDGVRTGTVAASARSQESLAVSADGETWFLLNASPDIRSQIEAAPQLHPRRPRHSPLAGVVLTSGDVDHCLGLFCLREAQPLVVASTERVWRGLAETNALFRTLQRFPGHTRWLELDPEQRVSLPTADGAPSGLTVQAVALTGAPPLHLRAGLAPSELDNIGLLVEHAEAGAVLAYFPGCAQIDGRVRNALARADAVFFDGTFWSNWELKEQGLGERSAFDMGHVPVGGAEGSMETLQSLTQQRFLIHINNTNPVLREDSAERRFVEAHGWRVASDGLELVLGSTGARSA